MFVLKMSTNKNKIFEFYVTVIFVLRKGYGKLDSCLSDTCIQYTEMFILTK